MKKTHFIFMIFCCGLSCSKDSSKQYSDWYINGEHFHFNDLSFSSSKGGTYLAKEGTENGFSLGWGLTSPPPAGYIAISTDTVSHNPGIFSTAFYKAGAYYRLSAYNPDSVLVSYVNGKIRYEMASAWFTNYFDSRDSVLISGEFNEP